MELKFEVVHRITFDEFYEKRERKFVLRSTVRKAYNELIKNKPDHEWIIRIKFYDTHIEWSSDDETGRFEYQQYNGILDTPQFYILHRFGENVLKVSKSEFVFGNREEFPYFVSAVADQSAPSQLIFPRKGK